MVCDDIFERGEHPSGGSAPRRPVQGGALGGGLLPTPHILPPTLCNSNREKIIRIEANPFAVSVCSRSNREKIAVFKLASARAQSSPRRGKPLIFSGSGLKMPGPAGACGARPCNKSAQVRVP